MEEGSTDRIFIIFFSPPFFHVFFKIKGFFLRKLKDISESLSQGKNHAKYTLSSGGSIKFLRTPRSDVTAARMR